ELGVLEDDLVASAEIDDDVVAGLLRRVDDGLRRGEVEVAHVDAVARFQTFDAVDAAALPEQEDVVAPAAVELVVAGAADQALAAAVALENVLAGAADQRVVAAVAENLVVAGAAVDEVVAAVAEHGVVAAARIDLVVAAEAEDELAAIGGEE